MVLHELKVVVWKNLIIRKRHWFLTLIEAVLPVCLFFLIAYARSKITSLSKIEIADPTYNQIKEINYDIQIGDTYLLYTPGNDFYNGIISKMHAKLQMPYSQVQSFGSQEELLEFYYQHLNYTTVAIVFEGTDPKKFNYKIRYHDPHVHSNFLSTGQKYDNMYSFVPGSGGVYERKDFVPIQLALDMAYIEYNLNINDLENNISVCTQEFPYPPFKKDVSISSLFIEFLPLITLFSFIFICPAVLKRVVEEKYLGTKELMKMVGMKSWMLWLGWFIYAIIPMITAVIFIVIFMKVPMFGSEYPLIEYSCPGILFFFLILYCLAAIAFCFAISSWFNKPTIALVTGLLLWILSYVVPKYAFSLDGPNQLSWSINILLNLLPNMAIHYGYSAISVFEEREVGIHCNNFYKSGSGGTDDITMLNVYLMLIFDIIFYTLFTLYMDGVNPGKYGVKQSFLFPIQNFIKVLKFTNTDKVKVSSETVPLENVEEGTGLEKGIEITGLYKNYGKMEAVKNLNLDIYKNQITVLLGHNGAGKSTTMSMITGMIEATSGSIKINGLNVKNNMDEIRHSLGLCPQHNLLFNDLTVKEHLLFFAKLKGKTSSEADRETEELLKELNLTEKRNAMAHTLSGGMQRKLCLGMALVGGSKVLILDEPSSGMDPESRRHLWDLLLKWRGEKTILITTHFMEEADTLGDWIAIMVNGTRQCYGTPMYLKKKYDTGYHLSLMINDSDDREKVISKIKSEVFKQIPEAQFKSLNGNNIVFVLPFENTAAMTELLEYLEENKVILKIDNISVTITTLEDVFLKTRLDCESNSKGSSEKNNEIQYDHLVQSKMRTLFIKKWQFFIKKWKAYLVPILIAVIFFCLAGYLSGSSDYYVNNGPELKLELNSYGKTSVFYNGTKNNDQINKIISFYKKQVEEKKSLPFEVDEVEQEILKKSTENIAYYKEHMIAGANFETSDDFPLKLIALYNAVSFHSMPISVNLIMDSLAKALLGPEYSISISNWPLPTIKDRTSADTLSEAKVTILWLIMIPVGCLFIHGNFIILPHTEISTKFVRLQYMCGVKPIYYWIVNFIADMASYVVLMLPLSLIIWLISPMLRTGTEFGYLFSIFLLYGLAGIPFAYLFSRKKSVSSAFALFIISGMFLGVILTVTIQLLLESQDDYYMSWGNDIKYVCLALIPQVGLTDALVTLVRRSVLIYNNDVTPKRMNFMCRHDSYVCCQETEECIKFKNHTNVFNVHLLMLISCVLYLTINAFLDSYCIMVIRSKIYSFITQYRNGKPSKYNKPNMKGTDNNTLNAKQLSKLYSGKEIVKNINLTLKGGQCMGILGVNGAGKTTTFRMLTREEVVDNGSVEMNLDDKTYDIENEKYIETLGYCPQTDSLNFVLTGRQILTTIANLRGINDPNIVNQFLETFDLAGQADKPCGHYSGGNKRKLSLAVSLIGYCKFVLLDEPTNGVDPSARRKCWDLIKLMQQKNNLAFILTSHSMTECEALCSELKIMKGGEFVAEGNLADLKNKHGGFSLKLKLCKNDFDEVDGNSEIPDKFHTVEDIKNYFTKDDRGEVKDEHSGLLHLYIKQKDKTWSKIFQEVEGIKARNPHLIEDYAISEASLEDIFLKVARSDEENNTKEELQEVIH